MKRSLEWAIIQENRKRGKYRIKIRFDGDIAWCVSYDIRRPHSGTTVSTQGLMLI